MKQFLKPDWRKIIIFIIVSVVLFLPLLIWQKWKSELTSIGFPIPFYSCHITGFYGFQPFVGTVARGPYCFFSGSALIIDLIIWYFLSCFIIWIYDKLRKKPQ